MGWIGCVHREKNSTRLRGTNFCTSSARFAPSFVRQPNGHKCIQMVRNAQNMSLGSHGVDRVLSLRKILTRLCGTNFCSSSECFASSFVRQPNGHKCTKSTSSARFALSFVRQPNGPKWIQMVRNAPKHEFRVPWGGPGAFVAKNSDTTL